MRTTVVPWQDLSRHCDGTTSIHVTELPVLQPDAQFPVGNWKLHGGRNGERRLMAECTKRRTGQTAFIDAEREPQLVNSRQSFKAGDRVVPDQLLALGDLGIFDELKRTQSAEVTTSILN